MCELVSPHNSFRFNFYESYYRFPTTQLTIRGSETELSWRVIGCYKITILNLPVLPGNLSHKKLRLTKKINLVEINFYGIRGQRESKRRLRGREEEFFKGAG